MEKNRSTRDYYGATISAPVSGQVAVGRDIRQETRVEPAAPPSEQEMEALRQAFDALREQVAAGVPPEQKTAALAKVDELAEAVTTPGQPDLPTMESVRNWFSRHLPGMAGAVTGLIFNPIVGKLVSAAGDIIAAEFKRRFGLG